MSEVLVALSGLPDEPELVRAAEPVGLRVVRRCVDAVDLLAAAALAERCPVVVAATLPRLTPDVVARLGDRLVVGVAADALGEQRLQRLGIDPVIMVAPAARTTMQQVADVCAAASRSPGRLDPREAPDIPDVPGISEYPGISTLPASGPLPPVDPPTHREAVRTLVAESGSVADPPPGATGCVIAVWGPQGAPGRTTVALGVSECLAREGHRVCLVDADTYGPSVALALGLIEDTSGLLVAARHAESGSLSARTLASLTMSVPVPGRGHWRVLGGLPGPDRWRELRRSALDRIWAPARDAFDVTVVDIGFCLESDDEAGAWARERNAAALSALSHADHVLTVGDSSVLGAARLVTALARLREVAPQASVSVIRNRARGSAAPWREAIAPLLPEAPVLELPEDSRALAACWEQGRSLGEGARRSRIRRAMEQVAAVAVSG